MPGLDVVGTFFPGSGALFRLGFFVPDDAPNAAFIVACVALCN